MRAVPEIIELPAEALSSLPAAPVGFARGHTGIKLYVATPCFGCRLNLAYVTSLLQLQGQCAMRGVDYFFDFLGNESLVERARNILVARFLASDASHLLFIDADIGFNPDTVFRLLDSRKDVVTAVYAKKGMDWGRVKQKLAAGSTEPVHQMGLVTLTHTPSPMAFLQELLQRPANERAFLLLPVGHPAPDAQVPDIHRKPLEAIAEFR